MPAAHARVKVKKSADKKPKKARQILLSIFVRVRRTQLAIGPPIVKPTLRACLALLILLAIAAHPRKRERPETFFGYIEPA